MKKCKKWDLILTFRDGQRWLYLNSHNTEKYRDLWTLINKEFARRRRCGESVAFTLNTAHGGELVLEIKNG